MAATNRNAWAQEERAEYETLLRKVVTEATTTPDRLDLFQGLLADAIQAHRYWAHDIQRACARRGAASEIKRYLDRIRTGVASEDRVVSLPAYQGTKIRTVDGEEIHLRDLIEAWSWTQIVDKRAELLKARRVFTDKTAHCDRLLVLRELCPDATSPAEAAKKLGTTVDDFLAQPDESRSA